MNGRRKLIFASATLPVLLWKGAVRAQVPASMRSIGMLSPFSRSETARWYEAFRTGLRELGWVEGKNFDIAYRYAEGDAARLVELVADLVRLKVDIIVTTVTADTKVAKNATNSIPIVMASAGDPVTTGLIQSLARPGGNITGLSQMTVELVGKRLELLKDMVPKLSRVAVAWDPGDELSSLNWKEIQFPARQLKVELYGLEIRRPDDFNKALESAAKARADALAIMPGRVFFADTVLRQLANLAVKNRLPSIYNVVAYADSGGLMAYGPDRTDMYRRAAAYVDKILKGAKPGDLPVEQPTKFEMVINLKTAKALGLTIPSTILVRADRVIE